MQVPKTDLQLHAHLARLEKDLDDRAGGHRPGDDGIVRRDSTGEEYGRDQELREGEAKWCEHSV